MDITTYKKPLFPVSRLITTDDFRYYSPYKSGPVEDLLECVRGRVEEPTVLLLGCGDLSSVFYSIWKNFDTYANDDKKSQGGTRCSFTQVKFVLNDYSAAVLARDVLFLYLCLQKPKEESGASVARWLGAIWAIWYCHELLSNHERLLSSALSALVSFGAGIKAWSSEENPLRTFVRFTSKYSLRDVCDVWKMWQNKSFGPKSVEMMKQDRTREKQLASFDLDDAEPLEEYYGPILSKTSLFTERKRAMRSEVNSYLESGSAFAECVLNESFASKASPRTSVNSTFYERPDGVYSLCYNSLPYRSYHQTFQFLPSQLTANGVLESLVSQLPVPEISFEQYPLLANSVQQLALWLYSCACILAQCSSSKKPCLSFTFHCSDAIQFCREVQNPYHGSKLSVDKTFDAIHTSTLCEKISLSNILLYSLPFLKPDGLLYTGTIKAVGVARTSQAYIGHSTGCNAGVYPIIYGIRTLSFDGCDYESFLPATPEQKKLHGEFQFTRRVIIWKRVMLRHALKMKHLGSASEIGDSLIATVLNSLGPKENAGPLSSTKTAIRSLQTFVSQAAVDPNDYNYWFRICDLVAVLPRVPLLGSHLKRFLPDLQMQAYVHGLHIHLAVKEISCPVCRGLHLYEYLGQYCIETELCFEDRLGVIVAYLHDEELQLDNEESTYHGICTIAMVKDNKGSKRVKFIFHAPSTFEQNGYTVTLITSNGEKPIFSGKLSNYRVYGLYSHSFDLPPPPVPCHTPTSFGTLKSHLGNGHVFNSEISMTDEALDAYSKSNKLKPKKISVDEIELSCGEYKISISYPYPIDYDSISLKVSKKNKSVTIEAKRTSYDFEQEIPVYQSNPSNPFLMPQLNIDKETINEICQNQFNSDETALRSSPFAPPLVKIKNIISKLLRETTSFFFTYSEPDGNNALIIVNNRVFDYARKTPAIDISFCFAKNGSPVVPIWSTMVESPVMTDITSELYQLLEKVIKYFAKRTVPSSSSSMQTTQNEKLNLLTHWKLDPCFDRAVIYPIYYEPDPEVKGLPTIDDFATHLLRNCNPEIKESYKKLKEIKDLDLHEGYERMKERERTSKCSYCGKTSESLKKCTRCLTVQYCNRDCQQKHWKLHKASCKEGADKQMTRPPTSTSPKLSLQFPKITQCHYCSKILKSVKKCGGCSNVTYCNKYCQEQHWKYVHKYECLAATLGKAPEMSTSFPEYSDFSDDHAWPEVNPATKERECSYCNRSPSKLKDCHCGTACYCGGECRKKDWEKHRGSCKCNRCGRMSQSMMMCPCFEAAYCGRICQKTDWPNHKPICPRSKKK